MNISIKDVLQRIRRFFILYIILLCACFAIKLIFSREEIYFAVNSMNYPWADYIAPYFTDMGDGLTIIILSAILALFNYRAAFLLATSWGITSIAVQAAKYIFKAARPKLYFSGRLNQIHFVKGVDILMYHSFPSGHTVTAFSAAVVISYLSKNKKWSVLLLLWAIMVGYSRMYLSEHFFEDVIAGSAIGVFVTIFWIRWLDSKDFIHNSKWNKGVVSRKS